jgi:RNA polymerase sigma factor (sigma-70 family)
MDDQMALEDIRNGGQTGYTVLYKRYVESLRYRVVAKHHISKDDVDDVLQEIFLKFFKSLPGFKQDCSVSSWLHWIANSVASDYWRKKGKEDYPREETDESQDDDDDAARRKSRQAELKAQNPRTISLDTHNDGTEESTRNDAIDALLEEFYKEQSQKAQDDFDIQMCLERALAQLERDGSKTSLLNCLKALTFQAQGSSIAEIAQALGRTPDATRRYLSDCRTKLRQYQPIQLCRELLFL